MNTTNIIMSHLQAERGAAAPAPTRRHALHFLAVMLLAVMIAFLPGQAQTAQAATKLKGIDVSHYQGRVNWTKVKEAGVSFAMIGLGAYHSTYTYLDPYFKYNMEQADAAGIKVGVYLYSYASTTVQAKKEAAWVLKCIDGYNVSYPVAFDMEEPSIAKLSREEKTQIAEAFLEIIRAAGYYPMLYASDTWFQSSLNLASLTDYDFWVARWKSKKSAIETTPVSIWQYSATGRVDGISGAVDLSYSYKDYASIITPRNHPIESEEVKKLIRTTTGWEVSDGKYYYYKNGVLQKGWFWVGKKRYYADPTTGERVTGWLKLKGKKYYLTSGGSAAKGFVKIDGKTYYFDRFGKMLTGFQTVKGKTYYMKPSTGERARGYVKVKGKTYYLRWNDSTMATGWVRIKGKWHYFTKKGVMKKSTTWKGYVFDSKGVCKNYKK